MLRNITILLVSFLVTVTSAYAQVGLGSLKGSVIDADTKEPIPFCKVLLTLNGRVKAGANTDFGGKFQINSVAAGSYDVLIKNETEGFKSISQTGVIISSEKITFIFFIAKTF